MAASEEVNLNDSKMVVPLHTWVLISNFKLAYNLLRRPDGTFNRHLAEFLDRKVPANANPVDGVFSFDVIVDRGTNLLCRIYRPTNGEEHRPNIAELEKPVSSEVVVPVIIFFHGGSFAHSSANSAIYDILCRRLVGTCKAVVVSVNYRRAPENRYPCAYDDGWTVLKWAKSRSWLQSKDSIIPYASSIHKSLLLTNKPVTLSKTKTIVSSLYFYKIQNEQTRPIGNHLMELLILENGATDRLLLGTNHSSTHLKNYQKSRLTLNLQMAT